VTRIVLEWLAQDQPALCYSHDFVETLGNIVGAYAKQNRANKDNVKIAIAKWEIVGGGLQKLNRPSERIGQSPAREIQNRRRQLYASNPVELFYLGYCPKVRTSVTSYFKDRPSVQLRNLFGDCFAACKRALIPVSFCGRLFFIAGLPPFFRMFAIELDGRGVCGDLRCCVFWTSNL
jgi:hypothetical protein